MDVKWVAIFVGSNSFAAWSRISALTIFQIPHSCRAGMVIVSGVCGGVKREMSGVISRFKIV